MFNQSNTMPAPMRVSDFIRYSFESQRNWLNYQVRGQKFNLELYPALDCDFPTITIEHEPFTLRESSPLIEAFRTYSEYKGKRYQIISTLWSEGTFFKGDTALRVYAFQDGKQVHMVQFPGSIWDYQAAISVLLDLDYHTNAKEVPQSKMKTTINDVDLDTMTRSLTASIAADGMPVFEKKDDALMLRKKGIDLKNFQYWKWAKSWQIENWKAIICERYDGKFEYFLSDQNGQRREESDGRTHTLVTALVYSFESWKRALNPK